MKNVPLAFALHFVRFRIELERCLCLPGDVRRSTVLRLPLPRSLSPAQRRSARRPKMPFRLDRTKSCEECIVLIADV